MFPLLPRLDSSDTILTNEGGTIDLSRFTISGKSDLAAAMAINNRRLIFIRWLYLGLLVVVASTTSYIVTDNFEATMKYVAILLFGYTFNLVAYILTRKFPYSLKAQRASITLQLAVDLAICGLVTFAQGGVIARTTIMYMFPIMAAGLVLSGNLVVLVAAFSGLVYVLSLFAFEVLAKHTINWDDLLIPMIYYPFIFLILARITVYLSEVRFDQTKERAYDSFLSLIAHQLKHPISAAITIIDTINHTDTPIDPKSERYITMLKGENENLVRLIDNLMESAGSKKKLYKDSKVNLVELVSRAAEKAETIHMRPKSIQIKPTPLEITVSGDAYRLGLAFVNMFDNALRYSKDGSDVMCIIKKQKKDIIIAVRDSGYGFNVSHLEKLQERFVTALNESERQHIGGLGLGVYVTRHIVEAHGGILDITSSKDHGTRITIKLPGESS
jgi:signal transduction histidine kinase